MIALEKNIRTLFVLFIILSIMACATSPIELSSVESVPQNDSIVFGAVKVIINGQHLKHFHNLVGTPFCHVIILPKGSSKGLFYPVEDDGFFYWHLPRGTYSTIAGLQWQESNAFVTSTKTPRIFAHFATPKEKSVVYIGTLIIILSGEQYRSSVEDEFDLAVIKFQNKYPGCRAEITKSLMEVERQR
jgi:hypothetical protein